MALPVILAFNFAFILLTKNSELTCFLNKTPEDSSALHPVLLTNICISSVSTSDVLRSLQNEFTGP